MGHGSHHCGVGLSERENIRQAEKEEDEEEEERSRRSRGQSTRGVE